MNLAPIILFVYNRPWHTLQTLEALLANELSVESKLYIYCDGPKEKTLTEDLKKIEDVRKVIREKKWCGKVEIKERENNLGLANSVINGVTEVIEKHGKVIVLEDDIVTSRHFLNFMNDGLNVYEHDNEVFGISGYAFPSEKLIEKETYFLPIMSSWGYATWNNRWSKINFNGKDLLNQVENKSINNKLNFSNLDFLKMLKDQVAGLNDSWAVRFYVSMYLEKGLFLYPKSSLLKNIGFDGTGVHCKADENSIYNQNYKNNIEINVTRQTVKLDKRILNSFNKKVKRFSLKSFKKKVRKKLPPEIVQLLIRKFKKKNEYDKMLDLPRYTKTSIALFGVEIIIPDNASYHFMRKEIFDENIYRFKTENIKPYIIDGGANIGLASIYFKLLFPNADIVAFEPDPDIFNFLKSNIKTYAFDNIELIKKGLWNEETFLSFKAEGADAGLLVEFDENSKKVPVTSLKKYLNKKVDFLKLDIEGAETVVIKDIEDDLDKVERIFVEYHSFVNEKQSLSELISILTNANFRLFINTPGVSNKSPFVNIKTYNNMDMQLNIYGIKTYLL